MLREIHTRFGREHLGYVAFIEPMLYVAVFVALFTLGVRSRTAPSGMSLALFMLTGFLPFIMFRQIANKTMGAVRSNHSLLYFPQVTLFDMLVARAGLEVATMSMVFIVLAMGAHIAGQTVNVDNPVGVAFWFLIMALSGFGMGILFGSLAPMFPSVERLVSGLILRPLFFTSGLFFTADMLPSEIREIALLNPLLQILELLRSSFFVEFESNHADPAYPLIWCMAQMALALLLLRVLRRKIIVAARS